MKFDKVFIAYIAVDVIIQKFLFLFGFKRDRLVQLRNRLCCFVIPMFCRGIHKSPYILKSAIYYSIYQIIKTVPFLSFISTEYKFPLYISLKLMTFHFSGKFGLHTSCPFFQARPPAKPCGLHRADGRCPPS